MTKPVFRVNIGLNCPTASGLDLPTGRAGLYVRRGSRGDRHSGRVDEAGLGLAEAIASSLRPVRAPKPVGC